MERLDKRIYLQYRPDERSLETLHSYQAGIDGEGRSVPASELHLTIIHFGELRRAYDSLRRTAVSELEMYQFVDAAEAYALECEALAPKKTTVTAVGIAAYGRGGVLVLEVAVDAALQQFHAAALEQLIAMFTSLGVQQPERWMAADPNFCNALSLRPHISLVKAWRGTLPQEPVAPQAELTLLLDDVIHKPQK